MSSTSRAAEVVAQEEEQGAADAAAAAADQGDGRRGKSAAIASQLAAEVYGLDVLREGIEDRGDNVTRFFILRREDRSEQQSGSGGDHETNGTDTNTAAWEKYKSLIAFTIAHGAAPGALAHALGIFRKRDFNLTSIDTRPSRVRPWHYIFFVECEQAEKVGDSADRTAVDRVMADLGDVAQSCRHLGRWRDELGRVEAGEDSG